MNRLKEQLAALTEEKNALLDYIEDNAQPKPNNNAELADENAHLKGVIEQLQKQLSENLMKAAGETFGSQEAQSVLRPERRRDSSQGGQATNRSHVTNRTDRSSAAKDVESRLRISMENVRTLTATLNETQAELEALVSKHDELSQYYNQEVDKSAQLQALLDDAQQQLH